MGSLVNSRRRANAQGSAALGAVAVVTAVLSFEPDRTAAGEFLDALLGKRFEVVIITPQDMAQLQELLQRGETADPESLDARTSPAKPLAGRLRPTGPRRS